LNECLYMHVFKHLNGISLRQTDISCKNPAPQCHSNILCIMFSFLLLSLAVIPSPAQQLHSHLSPIPHSNPQLPSAILLIVQQSYGLGVKAVKEPFLPRRGAPVPLAVRLQREQSMTWVAGVCEHFLGLPLNRLI
jgi:hypothetical protein